MKIHVKIRNLLTAAGVAAILATQSPKSFADDKKANAKEEAAKAEMHGYDLIINDGVLIEPDGTHSQATISTVVEALRKLFGDANIVMARELGEIPLADLKLHARDLSEMLEAIRIAGGNKFDWSGPGLPSTLPLGVAPGAIDPTTGLPLAPATVTDPNGGLYVLSAPSKKGQNERVVEAFNISPFLDRKISEARSRLRSQLDNRDELERFNVTVTDREVHELQEDIVTTVANFKQTDENNVKETLKFRFHSGASLLVAIGPRDEVEVVRKMMNALMTDPTGVRVDGIRTDLTDMQGEEKPQPVSVEAIPVKVAKMDSAYAAAMSLLADKRSKVVLTDARSKTLIVQATKAEVVALRAAIEQLDKAARQSAGGSSGSGGSGSVPQKDQ